MDRFKQLSTNVFAFAIGNVLSKLILFLLMPLYTSALTTSEYGTADLLINSVELLLPIFTLCISDAVFRFSIDKDSDHKIIFNSAIGVILKGGGIFFIIGSLINFIIPMNYWILFFVLVITNILRSFIAQFVRGIGKVKEFVTSGIISAITLGLANVLILLVFKGGIRGYLVAIILSNLIPTIYLAIKISIIKYIDLNSKDTTLLKSMLIFSVPNIPNMLSWWINNVSSRYIISFYCSTGAVGLFAAASKLPALINILSSIFQQAWQYSAAKEYNQAESEKFYSDVFEYYTCFITCASAILLSAVPLICKIILRGSFFEGWKYVPLLLISATIGCYSIYFGTFYSVVKNNLWSMISTLSGAAINLVLCFLLIPKNGIYGALIANLLSSICILLIRIITTKKYVNIKIKWKNYCINMFLITLEALLYTIGGIKSFKLILIIVIAIFIINLKVLVKILNSFKIAILKSNNI